MEDVDVRRMRLGQSEAMSWLLWWMMKVMMSKLGIIIILQPITHDNGMWI